MQSFVAMCVGNLLSRMYWQSQRQFARIVDGTTIIYVPLYVNYRELEKIRDDTLTLPDFNVFMDEPIPEYEVDIICKMVEYGSRHIKWDKVLKYSEKKEELIRERGKLYFIDKLRELPRQFLVDGGLEPTFVRLTYLKALRASNFMPRFVRENLYLRYEGNEELLERLAYNPLMDLDLDTKYVYADLKDTDVVLDKVIKFEEAIEAIIKEKRTTLIHETLKQGHLFYYFE